MQLSQKDIRIIRQYFADQPVKKAFLFGSQVRDEADENSDIDILVELDSSDHWAQAYFGTRLLWNRCRSYLADR